MAAQAFGLDIGRSFIKTVLVDVSGGKKILKAAFSVATPAGGVQSESKVDLEKVSAAIRTCVGGAKIDQERCNASIVESQVVTRLIDLPNLTDKELSAAINWEAEQYIPLPIKDVSLQYQVVSRPATQTGGKMSVLLIAAPKRVIEKYSNVVRGAKLSLNALETESASLVRSLTRTDDPAAVVVSMGAVSTELVIAFGGNVLFTRSIATGGVNLTRAIMAEFNLPESQAEEYKHTYGISEEKLAGKVAGVMKPILAILVTEILKASEYAKTHIQNLTIGRIIITGGGSYLPGLAEFLTEKTSLEVALGDPWADFVKEGLILKLSGQGTFYGVATGLALRE